MFVRETIEGETETLLVHLTRCVSRSQMLFVFKIIDDSSVRNSGSIESQGNLLVAADTRFLVVNADWASWSFGQLLQVYAFPGQWLAVNSMFICDNRSLFIDVGRASYNFIMGQECAAFLHVVNLVRVGSARVASLSCWMGIFPPWDVVVWLGSSQSSFLFGLLRCSSLSLAGF
jgi:hypothetical protein